MSSAYKPELVKTKLGQFLNGLPDELMDQLLTIVHQKKYRPGEIIFREGLPGQGFHLLAEGRVKIYKMAPDGKEQILHIINPGEPFGEAAIFLGQGYPASAQALTEAVTLYFPRQGLIRLITANAEMALGLLGVMARRLAHFAALLEAVTLKEVPARLAAFILELAAERGRAELALSKSQLASLLATTPETISRSLGRLKKAGLIAEEKPYIIIKDQNRLRAAAEGISPAEDDRA